MKNELSELLKQQRLDRGWGLVYTAKKLEISKSQLHNIEEGRVERPKVKFLKNAASLYGLPLDEVVIMGGRLPEDVYYKIIYNPELIKLIRDLQV